MKKAAVVTFNGDREDLAKLIEWLGGHPLVEHVEVLPNGEDAIPSMIADLIDWQDKHKQEATQDVR